MKLVSRRSGGTLYLYLMGELDEHAVSPVRAEADRLIDAGAGSSRAVINLAGVSFMDSTGIGFLLGRYKRLKRYGMEVFLEDPSQNTDKILHMSGIYSLMPKI